MMKYETTAKRLTTALARKNMKPQELADKSGVSKASISQYVNGTHAPSNISSGKMAKVLDVDPLWLMGFDVPMEKQEPQAGYYTDPETAAAAQEMFDNPDLRMLFDAEKDIAPEDLKAVYAMVMALKRKEDDTD